MPDQDFVDQIANKLASENKADYLHVVEEKSKPDKRLEELKEAVAEASEKIKVAQRLNSGKAQVSYMLHFPTVLEVMGRIMEFGATKYEDGNWKLGGKPDKEYLDSGMRHLLYWLSGEEFDPDSGCNHLGHAIWNLCALLQLNYPGHVFDEEIFRAQCKHWAEEKEKKNARRNAVPTKP